MSNRVKEIKAFSASGESQVDGKTIKHMMQLNVWNNVILIGFTDGQYVITCKRDSGWEANWMDRQVDWSNKHFIQELFLAGVITEEEATQRQRDIPGRRRANLEASLKQGLQQVERLRTELAELDASCPCCGK